MKLTKTFLFVLMLLAPMCGWAEEQGYAVFKDGTLTFMYGEKPSGWNVYDTDNNGYMGPGWDGEKLKKVVFHESFANARPKSTAFWFCAASELTEIVGLQYLNTNEVVYMHGMFDGCSGLTSLNVSHFNTSKVTRMNTMFCDCSGLTNLDVSNFNTGSVESFDAMFSGCSGLTKLDVSHFNTSKVVSMDEMFRDCSSLTSLDLRSFDTTHMASNGRVDVFTGCNNLRTVYISDNWDLEEVNYPANLEWVIEKERGFAVYDPETGTLTFKYGNKLSGSKLFYTDYKFDDNYNWPSWAGRGGLDKVKKIVIEPSFAKSRPKTTRGWFCFSNDPAETDYLTEIKGLEYLNTSEVTDMSDMFWGLRGLTSIDLSHFDTSNVLNMWGMFALCSGLTRIDLSRFDTSNVLNMMEMFQGCSSLTSLDLSHFDTSNVLRMDNMFKGCSGLTKLDLSHFNTSNVTNMSSMFEDCSSLTNLDLSDFNTSNVTNMYRMFSACSSLTKLDLSSFNTNNVTNMIFMFADCSSLRTIYVSDKWSTTKVTENTGIFYNCTNILGGKGTTYDSDNIKYARVDGGLDKPGYLTLINDDGSYPPEPEPIMPDLCLYNVLTSNTVALVDGSKVKGDYVIPETVKINRVEYTVTSIGDNAFYGNTALTSITIPKSIESIGFQAFSGCTGLTSFISLIENPIFMPWSSFVEWDDNFGGWVYDTPAILYIPKGTADNYISWENYVSGIVEGESTVRMFTENHIKYTVEADESIAIREVDGNYWTEDLCIPEKIIYGGTEYFPTKIKRNAFNRCKYLLSLTIPASITSIEEYGLSFTWNNLTSIKVEVGNPVYDSRDNCNAVIEKATNTLIFGCQETTIPSSVTTIGENAFYWCDNLLTIELPDNLVSIERGAFFGSGLRYIVLPPGLTSIGSHAFICENLSAVRSNIKNYFRLEESTFGVNKEGTYLPSKATLYVPEGTRVEYLNRDWKKQFAEIIEGEPSEFFSQNGALYQAQSENTVAVMGSGVVEAEYVIPKTVTHDGVDYTVTAIENEAFKDNTALTAVTIPETVVAIGQGAFAGCTGLAAIYAYAAEPANLATATTRAEAASSVFEGVDKETCVLYVPKGCVEKYRAAEGWGEFTHIVEMEGTGISGLTTNDHKAFDVYDMSGRKVRTAATSLDGLPKGIYIANGKKVILTK